MQRALPDPSILVPQYFGGNTLIEAYWKSDLSIPKYRRATFVIPGANRRAYRFRART